jgi:hypothetical protein
MEAEVAAYDSPGHADPLPGIPGFQSHDSGMTAPGSDSPGAQPGPYHQGGAAVGSAPVSRPYDSVATGIPQITQYTDSTTSAINTQVDPVSKADQTQDPGAGHVVTPHHPNAGR